MSDFAHRLTLDRIRDGRPARPRRDCRRTRVGRGALDLASLERLDAHAVLHREARRDSRTGRVKRRSSSVASRPAIPIPARVDEAFDLRFIAEPTVPGGAPN